MRQQSWMAVAILATGALSLPQAARAQEISKGLNIASVMFTYDHTSTGGVSGSDATLGAGLEHLLTDKMSAGGLLTWNHQSGDGESSSSGELTAFGAYYFTPKTDGSPYAAVRVGIGKAGDNHPKSFGFGIGYLKLFGAKPRGAGFKGEIAYVHRSYSDLSSNDIVVAVGVTFYFRSKH